MRGEGNMPGAGDMADEAQELARRLEAGRLERQTVERQQRLFRRMLDAGRTLQGREEDEKKERQSTTATGDSVHLPPALRARLEDDGDRLRVPTWEELQQFSPEERRLVVDYFRRLSQSLRAVIRLPVLAALLVADPSRGRGRADKRAQQGVRSGAPGQLCRGGGCLSRHS